MPATVFVSYKRGHRPSEDLLLRLEQALHERGHHLLVDRSIPAGGAWPKQLYGDLLGCSGAVLNGAEDALTPAQLAVARTGPLGDDESGANESDDPNDDPAS